MRNNIPEDFQITVKKNFNFTPNYLKNRRITDKEQITMFFVNLV